jgi:hypothetical protein
VRDLRRLSTTHRVAGVSAGQVLVWQLAALAVLAAPAGPVRYAAVGAAALGVALSAGRTRNGWWYQTAGRWLRHRFGTHRTPGLPPIRPAADAESALAWDGAAWVAVLAIQVEAPLLEIGAADRVLRLAALARLLGDGVSGVRVVLRFPGGGDEPTGPAGSAGRPTRCRAWLALRGPSGVAAGRPEAAALLRRRADRAARVLSGQGLPAEPLGYPALRDALREAGGTDLAEPGRSEPEPAGRPRWSYWSAGEVAEVCYRLTGAPPGDTLGELAGRLARVPADAVTLAVTLTEVPGGDVGLRVDLRASLGPGTRPGPVRAAVERAAHGWRPLRRDGEHAVALADTLPLGGRLDGVDGPGYATSPAGTGWLDLPLSGGGLLAGYTPAGEPVAVHLFGPARPRRVGVLADVPVARELVTAALRTGAAVVVRTARPGAWTGLGDPVPERPARVGVLGPDEPVPVHPVRPTVLVEDDPRTGAPEPGIYRDYPVIDVLPALTARSAAGLRRYDLLVLARTTQIDALHTGYDVPAAEGRWLARLPADVLALAAPSGITYVRSGSAQPQEMAQPQSERT